MKKVTLLLALFFAGMTFAQNQSDGAVSNFIFNPIPQQFGGGEIFRFDQGLVTQLDKGNAFDFNNSRWFSLGSLKTGSQTVYGIRFQLPNRGITMGYQDVGDDNPRIQWIGDSIKSNLEFRSATSFFSTVSNLNATMTFDGRTFFGKPLASNEPLVGIDYSTVPGNTKTGLIVRNNTNNGDFFTGIKTINKEKGRVKTGISVLEAGSSVSSTGVNVEVVDSDQSTGVRVFASSTSGSTFGVQARISSASPSIIPPFGAAIEGTSASLPNRFAGYFNGDVFVTGMFTVSDRNLKENIQPEENVLDKLSQLETVTYTFKQNEHLNLSSKVQHGFLAQNLEEVFPELVTTINKPIQDKQGIDTGSYEYKAVNYTGLISVLTSSLNEMNNKMTVLETELAELRNELATAKNELEGQDELEVGFTMEQNRPNPFTDQTVINYTLPNNAKATISVFDMSGKFVRDYNLSSQKGQVTINSSEIGKGMFIYSLVSNGDIMVTKKMIVK
ncbi:chaperone of endosialidase [Kordia sp. SMS9]|uniref:tail fiber domain-containing protein n=1 Tax=Kordia sp. SMS9 TaxID=2282170 RepID=UPI000E1001E3|nr:tail fiber domain-containing protein [Kordia sp. SMS9]AXG69680.1 chaperone of endosialidase [Kordia sp. SMS9]